MIAHLFLALLVCDPRLTRLFTPLHPQLGNYEVCADPRPIERVVESDGGPGGPHYTEMTEVEALDAFGRAGPYDRNALARRETFEEAVRNSGLTEEQQAYLLGI